MKRIYLIIAFLMVLALPMSCNEETVNLDPIGFTEAGYYQNEEQMTEAVFGVYQRLGFFYKWNVQQFVHRVDLLPSDDLTRTGSGPFENFVGLDGNNGTLSNIYQYAYDMIARANVILQKIEENGDFAYEREPDLRDIHRGEALFLRSWANYKLWNTFGTAPLVNERITDLENAFPPNSTDTELLDQAIEDLSTASQLLPDSWDDGNLGRATSNSARGLLVKSLVFRGSLSNNSADFTEAINVFNAISGVSLMPNYRDNFDAAIENNSESLFELQADDNVLQTNGWLTTATDDFPVIGEINAYYGYYTTSFEAGVTYLATNSLLNAYDPADPRLSLAFDTAGENTNVLKYISTDQLVASGNPSNLSVNNTRILRYADVMLLAAEAIVRSGGSLAEATNLVNQIRARARNSVLADDQGILPPPSTEPADLSVPATSEAALDMIFLERRLELAAEEGHRWYDLRRRHLAGEIDLTSWDFSSPDPTFEFREFNVNFPLPESEVIDNPNMNQNPGY
ncbi:RagB/SusD family nutrient uptake outer membrane protein [Poritiphilus flavus]|uniref:RagB/SusD family nutrient uptake outer membrane protein n=1 Tax=Poritiphilus flavus TaxID=2697053 RepID=A0A6L9E8F8_9FLAO|nr:RagB/SusD family nutrient uptake outer membrane protein [Poritiphilus flavus]NAS10739.1 RagB/SusD family nutrient uptake outer membrane protein [Poritiphilus flavus]